MNFIIIRFLGDLRLKLLFLFTCLCCSVLQGNAQTTFKFNALSDFEISKGGSQSHFYYNEIHQDYTSLRFSLAQINLISSIDFGKQWSFNNRLLLERDEGQQLNRFKVPQLNVQWLSKKQKFGLTIGSFINPFGAFNHKQLSTERNFISLPLAYAFYVNISDKAGFIQDMGDITKASFDGKVQWGSSKLYYGGYSSGLNFSWNIKPSKVIWKIALVNGAALTKKQITNPINYGITSRLKLQARYFWEQGFSFSHGSFLRKSEFSSQLDKSHSYTQSLLGTDFKLGSGFLEISGEVIASSYKVPEFFHETKTFETEPIRLNSLASYLDLKYELPVLPGSYLAYRLDYLVFNKLESIETKTWDNNMLRHSFALGYTFNKFLLARLAVSTQQVDNKNWDKTQGTFRLMITAHY